MILIITNKADGHVESVASHLDAADVQWARLNTEDLARNLGVTIDPVAGHGTLFVRDSQIVIPLHQVQAVWYRKPASVDVSHFDLDKQALGYVESEFREFLENVYGLLKDAYWINNPFETRRAHRKMIQLMTAKEVGFRTPPTLVTNHPVDAFRFADRIAADLAIKSLGAVSVTKGAATQSTYGLFTRRVTRHELEEVQETIAHLPTTFQEFIRKRSELRITCIGSKVYSCRIEARSGDLTADDYRFDTQNLNHVSCECPTLHGRLHDYMRKLDLHFACFDFIVPEHGEPIFLEANCNGQWLWVQNLTGLPIGKAIADELIARRVNRTA